MKMRKVMGGKFTTERENQEIISCIDDGVMGNQLVLTDVSICNLGDNEINVIINGGSKIPVDTDEILSLQDLDVRTVVIVEKGSTIKILGLC